MRWIWAAPRHSSNTFLTKTPQAVGRRSGIHSLFPHWLFHRKEKKKGAEAGRVRQERRCCIPGWHGRAAPPASLLSKKPGANEDWHHAWLDLPPGSCWDLALHLARLRGNRCQEQEGRLPRSVGLRLLSSTPSPFLPTPLQRLLWGQCKSNICFCSPVALCFLRGCGSVKVDTRSRPQLCISLFDPYSLSPLFFGGH